MRESRMLARAILACENGTGFEVLLENNNTLRTASLRLCCLGGSPGNKKFDRYDLQSKRQDRFRAQERGVQQEYEHDSNRN